MGGPLVRPQAVAKLQFRRQEERTAGRSKVVQKFLPMVETFSLYKSKIRTLSLRGFSAALRGTCPRILGIRTANSI